MKRFLFVVKVFGKTENEKNVTVYRRVEAETIEKARDLLAKKMNGRACVIVRKYQEI